jgi:hypothetical protein
MFTTFNTLLGASSSTLSSAPYCIADAIAVQISVTTSTASTSVVTVRAANADGFSRAIPDNMWSVVTVLNNQGIYTVTPGSRWLLVERANIAVSATSNTTVQLSIQNWI